MADAIQVQCPMGIVEALNAGDYSQEIKAVRSYAQWHHKFDVSENDGLRCDVVPVSRLEAELETRGSIAWSPRTDIVLRKKFTPSQLDEADGKPVTEDIDQLVLLVEEIFASLVATRIDSGDQAVWEKEEILASYMPSHLREKHQFTAVIRVTHSVSTDLP